MSASLLTDETSTLAAVCRTDDDGYSILISELISGVPFPAYEISSDSSNFAFLPRAFGRRIAALCADGLRLYTIPQRRKGSVTVLSPDTTAPIAGGTDNASAFTVCSAAPNLRFGYLRSGFLHVHMLLISSDSASSLPLRRFASDTPYTWYAFGPQDTVYAAAGGALHRLSLSGAPLSAADSIDLCGHPLIDAALCPSRSDTVCVLLSDGSSASVALASFDGGAHSLRPVASLSDSSARTVQWSAFGSLISVIGSRTYVCRRSSADGAWEVLEKAL